MDLQGAAAPIKKIAVLWDSIPKPLSLSHIKKNWGTTKYVKKSFPGVNANHLNYHIISTLSEDKPDNAVIHVGVNDMMNEIDRDDLILQIDRIGFTCKNYRVKNITISSLVYTRRIKSNVSDCVNKKLQELWNHQNYTFTNNSDIPVGWVTSGFKQ